MPNPFTWAGQIPNALEAFTSAFEFSRRARNDDEDRVRQRQLDSQQLQREIAALELNRQQISAARLKELDDAVELAAKGARVRRATAEAVPGPWRGEYGVKPPEDEFKVEVPDIGLDGYDEKTRDEIKRAGGGAAIRQFQKDEIANEGADALNESRRAQAYSNRVRALVMQEGMPLEAAKKRAQIELMGAQTERALRPAPEPGSYAWFSTPGGAVYANPKSGRVYAGPGGSGDYDMPETAEVRNRRTALGNAGRILDSIEELSLGINTNEGLTAKIIGAGRQLAAKLNLDPAVSEYDAMIYGFTPMFARAVGHVGVLTEQDVQSVRRLFPSPMDSQEIRDRKMSRIERIMGGEEQYLLPSQLGGDRRPAPGRDRGGSAPEAPEAPAGSGGFRIVGVREK